MFARCSKSMLHGRNRLKIGAKLVQQPRTDFWMQKKVLALAVAGLVSGVAFAQSNVTVFGVADAAYTYAKGKTADGATTTAFSGITSGGYKGPRLGFSGEEALGNGLKAFFWIEFAYEIDQDTGIYRNRRSYVGIDTPVGAFSVGRQYNAGWLQMGRSSSNEVTGINPMNTFVGGSGSGIPTIGGTMATNQNSRWNNSLVFTTKDYSGLTGRAIYAFGETATNQTQSNVPGAATTVVAGATPATAATSDNGRLGLSAAYTNGPITADVAFNQRQAIHSQYPTLTGEGMNLDEWYVGGSYNFNVVKLYASYQTLTNKNTVASAIDAKLWSLGISAPVGTALKLGLEYAAIDYDQACSKQTVANCAANANNGKSSGWGVHAKYDLSKRTFFYASAARFKNDTNTLAASANGAAAGALGQSNWAVQSGVSHTF